MAEREKVILMREIVLLALISVFAFNSWGAQRVVCLDKDDPAPDPWWYNSADAPLRFNELPNRRYFEIRNVSERRVVRYRIACVILEGGKVKVVRRMRFARADLGINEAMMLGVARFLDQLDECAVPGAKLAVADVEFADGGMWRLGR